MSRSAHILATVALVVTLPAQAAAAEEGGVLASLLDRAMENQQAQSGTFDPPRTGGADSTAGVRNWLASPPVLSASYLASDKSWGTDEAEVSLSLPFLSPVQRQINAQLTSADPALAEASTRYRRWQLSGVLRELVARRRLADAALSLALQEEAALEVLDNSSRELAAAGSMESYDLWLISQRLRTTRAEIARLEAQQASLQRSFRELTGAQIPQELHEPANPPPDAPSYHDHPESDFLHAVFEQQLAALKAGSSGLTPWTLDLIGRELAIPERKETQVGLAVSIPLDVGGAAPRSIRSSELALRRQMSIQLDSWRLDLREQWRALSATRAALRAELEALSAADVKARLSLNLDSLTDNTEMPIENRVQRRIELLRAKARPEILAAELAAVEFRLLQLAGNSL